MNKSYLKFSAMVLAGLLFTACGKDDDDENITPVNEPEFPTEYSELTVEQNKAQLEDNGIALINDITTLKNASGIQASIAFSQHIEGSVLPENLESGRVTSSNGFRLLNLLASFGKGKTSASKTLAGLRTSTTEFESFQQFYNEVAGVYTYNKASNEWTYAQTGSGIVFKFPSTEAGTTNNAQYTISDYKGVTINSELGGDYAGDYPTALKAELTIDGAKKMEYNFSATYNGSGDPSAVSISLSIDDYKFSYSVSNTTTEAKVDYALTQGTENLVSFGARAAGTFSSGAVNGSEDVADVISSGSMYFQIMNIKFSGEIKDTNALFTALEAATTVDQEIAAWNANYQFIAFYADSKKKIADTEFYKTTETYTYQDCTYDYETQEYVCEDVEVVDEDMEIRLVFADDSTADLAAYTETGFQDIQDKIDAFFNDVEND